MRTTALSFLHVFMFSMASFHAQTPPNYVVETSTTDAYDGDLYFSIIGPPLKPVNIASPSGDLLFSEVWPQEGYDWKVNDDGLITLFHRGISAWITRDSLLQPIDTTYCQNGYLADMHDFIRTPDGHKIIIAYYMQPVPMNEWVNGGDPNALIEVAIIQELSSDGQVIFEWNALDHMSPLDLENVLLTSPEIILNHANSIDIDSDGHFILSSRNLNEVTKIHRQTGEIIWRWGAGQTNEFDFIDSHPFTFQHSVRPIGNNRYLLFDNGNFSSMYTNSPNYSRAVEFELDTANMTATLVWEYVHPDSLFGPAMGSAQRLPNGNTLINWGTQNSSDHGAIISEITPDSQVALELVFSPTENVYSASKHNAHWGTTIPGCMDIAACNYNSLANVEPDITELELICSYPEEGYDCEGQCLEDDDMDAICNFNDNCPQTENPEQLDSDEDGIGDACEETSSIPLSGPIVTENNKVIASYNSIGQKLSPSDRLNYCGLIISVYSDGRTVKHWKTIR